MWCRFVTGWLVENVWKKIWTWISTAWRTCSSYPCAWWCLCCNRWACWIFLIVLTILAAVMFALLVIIANLVCIVCYIVCVIVCALPSIVGQPRCYALCAGDPPPEDGPSSGGSGSGGSGPGTGVGPQPGTGPGTGTGTGTGTNLRRTAWSQQDGNALHALAGLVHWRRLLTHLGPVLRDSAAMESLPPALRGIVGRYDRACGCAEGQVGAALAIAVFLALCFVGHGGWFGPGWASLAGTGFGFAVAGSMLGKAAGAVHARAVLRRELRAYFSGLDSAPAEAG
ncbi:MAG TPA: hypothetical protein VFV71_00815 [Burkholderiales bacterium]|nr:hypothetical protein [Burkholderiales bacterium]